jgi:hypothetical protein
MSNRGGAETAQLKKNVEEQMQRLLSQLEDLEAEKDNLEPEEYQDMRNDTIEQLREFKKSLEKMMAGNMTLVNELNGVQLVRYQYLLATRERVFFRGAVALFPVNFESYGWQHVLRQVAPHELSHWRLGQKCMADILTRPFLTYTGHPSRGIRGVQDPRGYQAVRCEGSWPTA